MPAKKIYNSTIKEQMKMYHSGDPEKRKKAIEEIVTENQKLVSFIIDKHFKSFKYNYYWEDLFQQGILGIIESLEKYDPELATPSTYFTFFIIHQLSEYCNSFIKGRSSHYSAKIKKINVARSQLEAVGIMFPTPADLAIQTGLKIDQVMKTLEVETRTSYISLQSEEYINEYLTDYVKGPDELYEEEEKIQLLHKAIEDLPFIEREVVLRKFGLNCEKPQTNVMISKAVCISPSEVRNRLQNAMKMLRKNPNLCDYFPDYANIASEINKTEISTIPVGAAHLIIELLSEDDTES